MPTLTDFSTLIALLLMLSGLVWAVDAMWLKPRRLATSMPLKAPLLVEYARSFFPVILVVLVVRCFVFEPFRIPSASMMPGLKDGDFIFVSKYRYGLRLPIINTRILQTGTPQRGDVIVFRLPSDRSTDFIKRLIGLPGDHVVVKDNRVFINGTEVYQRTDGHYRGDGEFSGADLALENLGGKDHVIMFAPDRPARDFDAVVPEGHYFFMGDNRNDSADGRFALVGFVPEENIVGPATRVALNWRWPEWHRVWMRIT